MKNYRSEAAPVTIDAPANVTSGQGLLVGTLFGVVANTAASGAKVGLHVDGVFELPTAAAQAWTAGAAIYWDDTNKVATTTSSGNTFIGRAPIAKGSTPVLGLVLLR